MYPQFKALQASFFRACQGLSGSRSKFPSARYYRFINLGTRIKSPPLTKESPTASGRVQTHHSPDFLGKQTFRLIDIESVVPPLGHIDSSLNPRLDQQTTNILPTLEHRIWRLPYLLLFFPMHGIIRHCSFGDRISELADCWRSHVIAKWREHVIPAACSVVSFSNSPQFNEQSFFCKLLPRISMTSI